VEAEMTREELWDALTLLAFVVGLALGHLLS
jgi:hypothetical protein